MESLSQPTLRTVHARNHIALNQPNLFFFLEEMISNSLLQQNMKASNTQKQRRCTHRTNLMQDDLNAYLMYCYVYIPIDR